MFSVKPPLRKPRPRSAVLLLPDTASHQQAGVCRRPVPRLFPFGPSLLLTTAHFALFQVATNARRSPMSAAMGTALTPRAATSASATTASRPRGSRPCAWVSVAATAPPCESGIRMDGSSLQCLLGSAKDSRGPLCPLDPRLSLQAAGVLCRCPGPCLHTQDGGSQLAQPPKSAVTFSLQILMSVTDSPVETGPARTRLAPTTASASLALS